MAGVFISYSAKDRIFATRLYDALRAENIPVWVDFEGISPAMPWQEEIKSAIVTAGAFIFVLSPDSAQSEMCQHELELAFLHQKHIIPVVARAAPLDEWPPHLRMFQSFDFTSAESFDMAARRLAQSIGPAMARVGSAPRAAPARSSRNRLAVAVTLTLALIVTLCAIARLITLHLALAGGMLRLAPQYLNQSMILHPFTWLGVTTGSVLLNLVLATGVVMVWRRGQAERGTGAVAQAPSGEIFISYSRSDGEFVDKLQEDLGNEGFKTWVDRRQLKGGQIWDATIVDALNRCQLALVVVSPDALKSGWVKKEYSYAAKRGKTLVPILFHPCPSIPKTLSRFQQLDFQAGLNFEAKYRYAFVELVAALDAVPLARVETAA